MNDQLTVWIGSKDNPLFYCHFNAQGLLYLILVISLLLVLESILKIYFKKKP